MTRRSFIAGAVVLFATVGFGFVRFHTLMWDRDELVWDADVLTWGPR
jgi:hypothetical protein